MWFMTISELENEIIKYIKDYLEVMNHSVNNTLDSTTILLEDVIEFDSLELAGLVAHLETLTNYDPFDGGFLEFFTIGELAKLFATK